MSDKPFFRRDLEKATPEQMREELDKHCAHIQQQDPKSLKFALMITGHSEASGDTKVYSVISGPAETLARTVLVLMDELVKHDPALAVYFLINFMQRVCGPQGTDTDMPDFNTGNADVEAQFKNLMDRLQNGTPPNERNH